MGSLSGTLYIGFSGNLHKRIFQHKFHHFEGFTAKYDVTRLLYWESYDDGTRPWLGRRNSKAGVG
jgi:putative endonuclease